MTSTPCFPFAELANSDVVADEDELVFRVCSPPSLTGDNLVHGRLRERWIGPPARAGRRPAALPLFAAACGGPAGRIRRRVSGHARVADGWYRRVEHHRCVVSLLRVSEASDLLQGESVTIAKGYTCTPRKFGICLSFKPFSVAPCLYSGHDGAGERQQRHLRAVRTRVRGCHR